MKCPYCSEEAPADARFCPACRGDLDAARRKGTLPQVKEYVDADAAKYGPGDDFSYTARETVRSLGLVFAGLGGLAAIVTIVALFSFPTSLAVWLSAGLGVTGCAAGLFVASRFSPGPNLLPMLQDTVDPGFVTEHGDVQFVVNTDGESVRRGEQLAIRIRFQNCVNRSRNVHIRLAPCGDARGWKFTETAEGRLGPGEVGELVLWAWGAAGSVPHLVLWVMPSVGGGGGRKVRHGPAKIYEPPVSGAVTAAALVFGALYAGGGLAVSFKANDEGGQTADAPLPPPEWKITATPDQQLLLRASAGD